MITLIKETNKLRPKESKLEADGINLQPFDTPYVPYGPWNKYNNVQFKWKPSNQLTIDFKIKIVGLNEWTLLTKTDQPFNINQPDGNPLPATCIPTDAQKLKYHDSEVVEYGAVDLHRSYSRPRIVQDSNNDDEEVSDHVAVRLWIARLRAMEKFREVTS